MATEYSDLLINAVAVGVQQVLVKPLAKVLNSVSCVGGLHVRNT
jgi:hypothetical protein